MIYNKIVFLDFDGVLVDSAYESYVVMCLAAGEKPKPLESNEYGQFYRLRPYVTHSWHYRHVWNILHSDDEKEADKLILPKTYSSIDAEYQRTFLLARQDLKKKDLQSWLNMHTPFSFMDTLKDSSRDRKRNFVILTTKDEESVGCLLKYLIGYNDISIIGKESLMARSATKGKIISSLLSEGDSCIFIDDSLEHLTSAESISRAKLLWATWGYVRRQYHLDNSAFALNVVSQFLN